MNCLNQISWVISVIFLNFRLIVEDLIIDPCIEKLTCLKSHRNRQENQYRSKQIHQTNQYELNNF